MLFATQGANSAVFFFFLNNHIEDYFRECNIIVKILSVADCSTWYFDRESALVSIKDMGQIHNKPICYILGWWEMW